MLKRVTPPLLVLVTSIVLAACGGGGGSDDGGSSSSSSSSSKKTATTNSSADSEGAPSGGGDATDAAGTAGATTLKLGVKGNELKFDKDQLTAPAGKVTLQFTNSSSIPHNVAIEMDGDDSEGELVTNGDVSEVTVDLEPGTYTYYCTPHKSAGMTGTLKVT
ncbi:MAG: hypothetical protein JWM98_1194 [Thermoleophilia bacterium]|nr:hypothetical protein [Thermoleophilia bacterium]